MLPTESKRVQLDSGLPPTPHRHAQSPPGVNDFSALHGLPSMAILTSHTRGVPDRHPEGPRSRAGRGPTPPGTPGTGRPAGTSTSSTLAQPYSARPVPPASCASRLEILRGSMSARENRVGSGTGIEGRSRQAGAAITRVIPTGTARHPTRAPEPADLGRRLHPGPRQYGRGLSSRLDDRERGPLKLLRLLGCEVFLT